MGISPYNEVYIETKISKKKGAYSSLSTLSPTLRKKYLNNEPLSDFLKDCSLSMEISSQPSVLIFLIPERHSLICFDLWSENFKIVV